MEWGICKNLILAFRKLHSQEIFFDDRDVLELTDILAELFGGLVVWLYGDYVLDAARKGISNDARAGADIDDRVTLLDIAMSNQKASESGIAKEMLAKFWFTHLVVIPSGARPHTLRWR